ncbi:MAG: FeoB-associated Cys-rich membrane protein [Flavobacteriaceae bacterium]|nr:FeoB-associated Cys-rich membrane protein [Flavobacteriaceae bacterium]
MQEILVYIAIIFAIAFLIRKFLFPSKKKKKGCDSSCNCH